MACQDLDSVVATGAMTERTASDIALYQLSAGTAQRARNSASKPKGLEELSPGVEWAKLSTPTISRVSPVANPYTGYQSMARRLTCEAVFADKPNVSHGVSDRLDFTALVCIDGADRHETESNPPARSQNKTLTLKLKPVTGGH